MVRLPKSPRHAVTPCLRRVSPLSSGLSELCLAVPSHLSSFLTLRRARFSSAPAGLVRFMLLWKRKKKALAASEVWIQGNQTRVSELWIGSKSAGNAGGLKLLTSCAFEGISQWPASSNQLASSAVLFWPIAYSDLKFNNGLNHFWGQNTQDLIASGEILINTNTGFTDLVSDFQSDQINSQEGWAITHAAYSTLCLRFFQFGIDGLCWLELPTFVWRSPVPGTLEWLVILPILPSAEAQSLAYI